MGVSSVPTPGGWGRETDVLVAGGGYSGLVTALRASQHGAKVIVVEASTKTGGTALFSGGNVHTWNLSGWEEFRDRMPMIDQALGKMFADTWPEASKWVQGLGLPIRCEKPLQGAAQRVKLAPGPYKGNDYTLGPDSGSPNYENKRAFFDGLVKLIQNEGGEIWTGTKAVKLCQDTDGAIAGMRILGTDGAMDVKAKAVVLATGGFQANKEMLKKYVGEFADLAECRAVPYNTGAGIMMGLEVGAMLSRGMGETYGHTQAFPIVVPQTVEEYERFDPSLLQRLMGAAQEQDTAGLLVNLEGNRFFDEGHRDSNLINQAIMHQFLARAFLIFDAAHLPEKVKPRLELLRQHGIEILEADSLVSLESEMGARFGVRLDNLKRTVDEYNAAVSKGPEACLTLGVPRTTNFNPVIQAPFCCVPVTAGVSMTYGGLATNTNGQVLDRTGDPIGRLFAVPGTAGGIFYQGYLGTLALMTTFGYVVGKSAAEQAKSTG